MTRLNQKFFQRKTEIVARQLLGKVLVRKIGKKTLAGVIIETEAYIGPHDLACHASHGKTERTSVMFGQAGMWYVYMIYGIHFNVNIITENEDYPAAVLIRALEPLEGLETMGKNRQTNDKYKLASGPGKLCRAMQINKKLNCKSATLPSSKLYIEDRGIKIKLNQIEKTKRIGVEYAGIWKDKLLRFYIKDSKFISKKLSNKNIIRRFLY